jgi:colanic acid biosynthesis glycosyl transferase WcaI
VPPNVSSRRPRFLVLTQHYEPESGFITADVARELAAVGDVTVVTAHPNYPLGRFFPGSRAWWPRRSLDGSVVVWRLPFFPDHSTSVFRRGLSYISFAVMAAIIAPFVAGRPDVVWAYHGPFTTALAALWFRWVLRARMVITSADLWPESLHATQVMQPSPVLRALYAYSRWINRQAHLIICATRGTLARFRSDGVADARLEFVPVWVGGIPESLASIPARNPRDQRIVYAGNLGPAQQLETVIRAAALVRGSHPDLRFDLFGAGASEESLKALAAQLGAVNVTFGGRIPPDEAFRASATAFAQIVCLRRTALFRMTLPSKLAFAIAAGSPILSGLEGEAAAVADESGAAFAFNAESPESLVAAIDRVCALDDAQRNSIAAGARAFYRTRFARRALLDRYRSLLEALARA